MKRGLEEKGERGRGCEVEGKILEERERGRELGMERERERKGGKGARDLNGEENRG